jgi:hypothetical protein
MILPSSFLKRSSLMKLFQESQAGPFSVRRATTKGISRAGIGLEAVTAGGIFRKCN